MKLLPTYALRGLKKHFKFYHDFSTSRENIKVSPWKVTFIYPNKFDIYHQKIFH